MKGWAYVVQADHSAEAHDIPDAARLVGAVPLVWIHLDGRDPDALEWLRNADLPPAALSALLAQETRPRGDTIGNGILVNLRGPGATPDDDPDRLVSIRIWADAGRALSVSFRTLADIANVCDQMKRGEILDPGDLVTAIATMITRTLDPDVAALGDTLDEYESALDDLPIGTARRKIMRVRSAAIDFRRFLQPQRVALDHLSTAQCGWMNDDDRLHLREAADRAARMAEELEAIRERSALLHEQLTDMRTEQIDQRALTAALLALIFLPLTFVTGLFGMNVPVPQWPHAFWWICALCIVAGAFLWQLMKRRR